MNTNIFKQRSTHERNFTIINNEILFEKDSIGNSLSLEALGLFWRIISLPKNWKLCINGLAKICTCSKDKINRLINELELFGYLEKTRVYENGKFNGYQYIIKETLDKSLWNISNEEIIDIKNEQKDSPLYPEIQDPEKQDTEIQDPENQYTEFRPQYNNIYNKEKNIIKDVINKGGKESLEQTKVCSCSGENLLKKETSNLENGTSTSLEENKQKELTKGGEVKTTIGSAPVIKKKTNAQMKAEQRRQERKRKHQEEIEEELNKPVQSVKDFAEKNVGELTDAENLLANSQRLLKQTQENLNEIERKSKRKQSIKNRILAKVEKEIPDESLKTQLKRFFSNWIERGKPITEETYNAQLENLFNLAEDVSTRIAIVKKSVEHSWTAFYPLENNINKKWKKPQLTETIIDDENSFDYDIAVDENGNPLQF